MRKFLFLACSCLFAAAASATTLFYSVEDSWNANPLAATTASTVLTNTTDGNTLTVDFVPNESGVSGVGSPTNTAWGSLYLIESGTPSNASTQDVYSFAGLTLNLELIDNTTSESVIYAGTLTGTFTVTHNNNSNSTSGNISWSPTGLQILAPPSTVSFVTDSSDSIGVALDSGTHTNPATTVNGTVESTPASTTPEPATMAMMGVGLLAVGLVNRRRRRN